MLSTENCTSNNPATSAPIRVSVIPSVAPSVSIVASANPICSGTAVTFTATPTNGGTSPQYQWYLGNTPIAGEVRNTYVTNALVNDDEISVEMFHGIVQGEMSGDAGYQAWADQETDPEVEKLLRLNGREETIHAGRVNQVLEILSR
jgi:hypothetical protein